MTQDSLHELKLHYYLLPVNSVSGLCSEDLGWGPMESYHARANGSVPIIDHPLSILRLPYSCLEVTT